MSLANRVSQELGESGPGKPDTYCGYQIRFEAKKCDSTRLLYCTTGVLLRKLQLDPYMSEVTHVIVDEVSEDLFTVYSVNHNVLLTSQLNLFPL